MIRVAAASRRSLLCLILSILWSALPAQAADWTDALRARVERIDQQTPGRLGVYVKRLGDQTRLEYHADRLWYLSSAVKVVIAIAVLQEIESGTRSLEAEVVLEATDKIDGSGALVWQDEGRAYRLDSLIERMLMESDNTAANLLVRAVGNDAVNRRARELLGPKGVGRITDFTQVRYDVYRELHPAALELSNRELVQVAAAPLGPERVVALRRVLSLDKGELKVGTIEEAYARYYARELNSASLVAYGGMLDKLVRGQLLSPEHTQFMFTHMKYGSYDAYRLEAGLPREVRFIHKTGTQWRRACHMGVIEPQNRGRNAIVVAVCAEDLDEDRQAGKAFERIGEAISQTLLSDNGPR